MDHPVCIFTRLAPPRSGRTFGNSVSASKYVSLSQTRPGVSLADRGLLVFQYHCAIRSDVVAVCRLWWWHFHVLGARCSPVTLFWPPRRIGAGSLRLRRGREEPHIHNLQQGSSVEFHDL